MSFITGTPILTNSGWKNIEDISGHDKILVRNFLGDAEFIQPFALKRKQYSGDVLTFGKKRWNITITPDHIIEYVLANAGIDIGPVKHNAASDIIYNPKNMIMRDFRYIGGDTTATMLRVNDKQKALSLEDWVTLLAYTLSCGKMTKKITKVNLEFNIPSDDVILCNILNYNDISWSEKNGKIRVDNNNNLAAKLIRALGSHKKHSMYLSNQLVFELPLMYRKIFMEKFMKLGMCRMVGQDRWMLATINKKLIDSVELFGYLSGYSVTYRLVVSSGDKIFKSIAKHNGYQMFIHTPKKSVSLAKPLIEKYDGYVYSIDIFEGQVYTNSGSVPVWLSPK